MPRLRVRRVVLKFLVIYDRFLRCFSRNRLRC